MNTIIRLFSLGVLCSALTAWGGSYEYAFDFTPADVTLQSTGAGETFVALKDGEYALENPGKPWIPHKDFSIRLPEGEKLASWTVELGETTLLAEGVVPMPEQRPVPTDGSQDNAGPTPRDAAAYASAEPYPSLRGEHLTTGSMRGIRIASFRVSPIWYVASEKKLYLAASVTVKVETTRPRTTLGVAADFPSSDAFEDAANSLVINPTARTARKSTLSVTPSGSGCKYLVITTQSLAPAAQKLADFRASFDNVTAEVVTIEDIKASGTYSAVRPDGQSDVQTKIRNCITWYVQNRGTEYVVLAGDDTVVPPRRVHVTGGSLEYLDAPSDLYYSDLDGDWDANKDGVYAFTKADDNTDLYPDVIVGRIPVQHAAQLESYVNKVIAYERNTTDDSDVVRKMLWFGYTSWQDLKRTDSGWVMVESGKEDTSVVRTISERFYDGLLEVPDRSVGAYVNDGEMWDRRLNKSLHRTYRPNFRSSFLYASATSWDTNALGDYEETEGVGGNVQKALNQGYHQMYIDTHGSTTSIRIEGLKSVTGGSYGSYGREEAIQLTNRIDFIYTSACNTGAFDLDDDVCLAEAFLRAKGGAVGYIGSSREGWGLKMYTAGYTDHWTRTGSVEGRSESYAKEFWKRLFVSGDTKLGKAFSNHKSVFISKCAEASYDRWLQLLINLQGDPLLTYHLPPANETNPRASGKVGLVTLLRDNLPETSASTIAVGVAVDEIPLGQTATVALEYARAADFSSATSVTVASAVRNLAEFTKEITGLAANTTYYVRGKVTMDGATHYSPFALEFKTKAAGYVPPVQVADPVFTPASCTFAPYLQVGLTCATQGATVRYTTDGSDPTEESPAYSAAFCIYDDTTVRARAFKDGLTASAIVEATYAYDDAFAVKGDDFMNPIVIHGTDGITTVDSLERYTLEDGEIDHAQGATKLYKSVWYEWTAPASGRVTFKAWSIVPNGSVNKCALAAYTGVSMDGLQRLASAGMSGDSMFPSMTFDVQQGTTYRLAGVVMSDITKAPFTLDWRGTFTATTETVLDPVRAPILRPGSCRFCPETNVTVVCATPDATVRYTLDASDPTESSPRYTQPLVLTTNATLRVRAFKTGLQPSLIAAANYTYDPFADQLLGETFEGAIVLSGASGTNALDITGYKAEEGQPKPRNIDVIQSIWYKWTAPGSGTVTLTTTCKRRGESLWTQIGVYTGTAMDSLTSVAEATPDARMTTLSFAAVQGTTYRILAGRAVGTASTGDFTLTWSGDLTVGEDPGTDPGTDPVDPDPDDPDSDDPDPVDPNPGAGFAVGAGDYYVSVTGNDSNAGTTTNTAFKTIAKAVSVATAGQKVVVLAGTHEISTEIAVAKAITITGEGWGQTIIRQTTTATNENTRCITLDGGAKLKGVTLTGGKCKRNGGGAWVKDGTISWCCISNNLARGDIYSGGGVSFASGKGTIDHCLVTGNVYCGTGNKAGFGAGIGAGNNGQSGSSTAGDVLIDTCLIAGNSNSYGPGAGIGFKYAYNTVTVRNCTVAGNRGSSAEGAGIYFLGCGEGSKLVLVNAIVTDNQGDANERNVICTEGYLDLDNSAASIVTGTATSTTYEQKSQLRDASIVSALAAKGFLSSAPKFVSASTGDYRLTAKSPAVGAGVTYTGIGADLAGDAFLTTPSIGCYEYGSSPAEPGDPDPDEPDPDEPDPDEPEQPNPPADAYAGYRLQDGTPQSVLLSYYNGPDTRGFAWQTSTNTVSGALWLLAGTYDASADALFATNQIATATSTKMGNECYCHKAHVLDLKPGTYSYRVGTGDHFAYGSFTVKAEANPFVALNVNDVQTSVINKLGCWDVTLTAARSILNGSSAIDMILSGGDFIDGGTSYSNYREWGVAADRARSVFPDVPWTMTSGNHDPSLYNVVIDENFQYTVSGHYGCHSYDVGNVHVATVPFYDSWNAAVGTWLENDLAACTSTWRVVSIHYGPYTTVDHGSTASESYVKAVSGICAKGRVDLVLQAHDHGYSKTLPYLWSGAGYTTSETNKAATVNVAPTVERVAGEDYYKDPKGTVYISVGCAGHRVGEGKSYATTAYKNRGTKIFVDTIKVGAKAGQDASLVPDNQMFGVLKVADDKLCYDWYLAETNGTATVFDSLRLYKTAASFEPDPDQPDPGESEPSEAEQVSETLFFTEISRHVLTTTNGASAAWSATATGNVRLIEGARTALTQMSGTGASFEVPICGFTAGGTGTVTVTRDGATVVAYTVTVLPDLDEESVSSAWLAAVKKETIRLGESVTKTFCHPSSARYWRYADGEYNTATRTAYTYSGSAAFTTDPAFTEVSGAHYSTNSVRSLSVTVTPTEPGTAFFCVLNGSGSSNQRHYSGVYELTVLPAEGGTEGETWDIPGTTGGINGMPDGKGGKYVAFKSIRLENGKLKVDFEAGKVAANGQTFGLVCKENLTDTKTFTINVTLTCDESGEFSIGSLEGLVNKPQLFILGIGLPGDDTGSGGTTPGEGDGPTPPPSDPGAVENSANIDLVTLTYNDAACTEYGVSFHSFTLLASPMVQIVEGVAASSNEFASARTLSGSAITSTSVSTSEYKEYDPSDYSFVHTYENRADVEKGVTTYIHKAVLGDLGFGRTYSYRVGGTDAEGQTMWSPIYSFTTRPQSVGAFSFIYTADTQPSCFDDKGYVGVNRLLSNAFAAAPNAPFLVSGGDFVYCSDEGQSAITVWRNVINGGNNLNSNSGGSVFAEHPWFVTNGNHDNNKVQEYFNNQTPAMSSDYYSYDYGDAHFVVLDSGHNGAFSTTQLDWLNNDLAGTSKKWKVIFVHFSLYCSTDRDLGVNKDTLAESSDRTQFLEYVDRYHVDLVVSAHVNESYYTSYPLYGGAKTSDEPTRTDGVDCYTSPSGTIYMQNGGSGLGSDLKGGVKGKINTGTTDVSVGFRNRLPLLRDAEIGYESSFAVIDISGDTLKVNRYYLDAALNTQPYVNGQFQISK